MREPGTVSRAYHRGPASNVGYRRILRARRNRIALGMSGIVMLAWAGVLLAPASHHTVHAHPETESAMPAAAHDHGATQTDIASLLQRNPDALHFCVSGSLEPIAGALAQIVENGGGEAEGRFENCVVYSLFDHVVPDLAPYRGAFLTCFDTLRRDDATSPNKALIVNAVTGCITRGV
jgi:hypothetical protein